MSSNEASLINSDGILNNCNESYLWFDSDISIEESINREVFVVDREFILFDLKKLAYSFGLKWDFCIARADRMSTCNRAHCQGFMKKSMLRNATSITCGCGLCVRFRAINSSNTKVSNPVIITYVCGVHSIMCDPSYVDQCVLARTRSGGYNNWADRCLREIMVQIAIDPFVKVSSMTELLKRVLPDKKIIDRYMINNVRIYVRKKKLELDYANIDIDPLKIDTTYSTLYQNTASNYS